MARALPRLIEACDHEIPASGEEGAATVDEDNAEGRVLERDQRLSRSMLWTLQRAFYEGQGIEAWGGNVVPYYITSNAVIGRAYARVVLAFLREWRSRSGARLDPAQPVYIVELGAGSGRFAHYFMRAFLAAHAHSILRDVPVTYVLTDVSERTLDALHAHPSLRPLAERGVLDFARFDAERPHDLTLLRSGAVLSPGAVANPLIVLANYFFDSIPQDCFSLVDGRLHENLVTLTARRPGVDPRDPALLAELDATWDRRPIAGGYYGEPDLDAVLQAYDGRLSDATFLFPVVALRCLRYLRDLSGGHLLVLSGDKGYSQEDEMEGRGTPNIAVHGSISLTVNYHAIGAWVRDKDGLARHPAHRPAHLTVAAYLLGPHAAAFEETAQSYDEEIEQGGPDDFFFAKRGIQPHYEAMDVEELLAWLRLANWDSTVFLGLFPALLDRMADASEPLRRELRRAVAQVWDAYYPIGEAQDLPFALGTLLHGLRAYGDALGYFEQSLRLHGPDPSTLYNMGLCHHGLGQLQAALERIEETLRLDPSYEQAIALRAALQRRLPAG